MGLGLLRTELLFVDDTAGSDRQGFHTKPALEGFTCLGVFDERSATTRWANLAGFEQVDAIARIRTQPRLAPSTGQKVIIMDKPFTIMRIENVKGRGRYLVLLLRREGQRG
ncbi:phage head completion protein [Dermabacteraceae bacterium P13138]